MSNILKRNSGYVLESKGYVGKNLFDKATVTLSQYIDATDGVMKSSGAGNAASDYIKVSGSTIYMKSGVVRATNQGSAFYDANKAFISGFTATPFVTPFNCAYIRFTIFGLDIGITQLELGSVATTYEAYSPSALNALSLVDRSRNQNNGTFSNVTWTQLPSGLWTMNFNGTTSYVEIPDSPTMRMTQGGTILAWIKANSLGESDNGRIIDKSSALGSVNGYLLMIAGTNNIYFQINGGTFLISSNNAVPFSTHKLVAITFGANRKVYVNAVDVTASGGSETALPPNVSGAVRIGNRAGATDRTFDGQISLPRIYNRVLSATELLRIFTSERGLFGV